MSELEPDWIKIQTEYITGGISYAKLAEKYGISRSTLEKRARAEKWSEKKKKSRQRTVSRAVSACEKNQIKRLARLGKVTDRLLTKLERAVDELNIQLATHTVKTRIVEYGDKDAKGKPTKETITEDQKIEQVKTIIDRSGVKAISSALRDIKEIQMIRADLDSEARKLKYEEQAARAEKIKREAERLKREADEASEDKTVTVAFGEKPETEYFYAEDGAE